MSIVPVQTRPNQVDYICHSKMTGSSFSRGRGAHTIVPARATSVQEALDHLRQRPNDRFMRHHLLESLGNQGEAGIELAISLFRREPSLPLFGFLMKIGDRDQQFPAVMEAMQTCGTTAIMKMFQTHPSPSVRSVLRGELRLLDNLWEKYFSLNRDRHLTFSEIPDFMLPITDNLLPTGKVAAVSVADLTLEPSATISVRTGTGLRTVRPEETFARIEPLLDRLLGDNNPVRIMNCYGTFLALIFYQGTRQVAIGPHQHTVSGIFHGSGKGLSQAAALVSAAMEVLERYSAAEGVGDNWPAGYIADHSLTKATLSELRRDGRAALDPNRLNLEYQYDDQPLHWVKGEGIDSEILVPAQAVFEDSNLDEANVVFTSSNGLASGNTMAEARLHALLEVIERDGDYSMYYHPLRTFTLSATDRFIGPIIEAYRQQGLSLQMLDLTTEYGVPTYRAFVSLHGQILSGSGAHLDGRIAAFRAICELNTKAYVYQTRQPMVPAAEQRDSARTVLFESLPSYSAMNIERDLALLEKLLIANGLSVYYVDLTRADLGVPVVRAIVPGLDIPPILNRRQVQHLLPLLQTDVNF
jgi:ribosomal protein S12 methylthiotransferase accessory factor